MRSIAGWSLKFRRVLVAAAVGVMIIGIAGLGKTPVDALPEFNPPMVEVQTEALGLAAEEVEQLITVPLEQDLLVGVPFLDEIESVSLPGLSSVVMTFEPGTDLLEARQLVQERLTQAVGIAGLPAVAKLPQMIQPLSSTSRVAMVKLSSEQLTPIQVSVLARWVIGPRLMATPGVANVVVWGSRDRQLQVMVDPQRLQQNGSSLSQVIRTAGNALEVSPLSFLQASSPGTGGFIDTPNQRLNIFHEQAISTPEELAQVPLEGANGNPGTGSALTLGDVADVVEGHQPLIGDAVCADGEDCLLLVVEKFPAANTIEVTEGIEKALGAMRPGLADLEMDSSVYRPASFVESSVANLGWALLVGGLLVVVLLGAVFWDWRKLIVSLASMAVSVGAAVVVLQLRDTTVNMMVTAGLVAGLTAVIYDAIQGTDAVARALRRREPGHNGRSSWNTIVESTAEMRSSALYAVLIVAAATVPMFFLPAEGDAFLPPAAWSYLLAVAASMLVALTLTPALAMMLLSSSSPRDSEPRLAGWLSRGYRRLGARSISRTGQALACAAVIALVGLAALPFLDTSLRPGLKERDVLVHLEAQPGTSLPRMTQLTGQLVDELGSVPGVDTVDAHVGRAVMSDETVDVHSGEIWVSLDPAAAHDATVESITSAVQGTPGLSTDVLTYSEERVSEVLAGSTDDLVVRVYGEDAAVLDEKATKLQAMVAGVDGVTAARVERAPTEDTIQVQVDLERAQAEGVKPGDVRRAAAILLGSITVGNLFDEQKVFDVVVWGAPHLRDSPADVEKLLIPTPAGGQVALGSVADVRVAPNPTVIRHESVSSYLDVTAQVSGRDIGEVATEIEALVDGVAFPLDHHAQVLSGYAELQADQWRLAAAALGAAIAILLLLQAAFGSWRVAALAFAALVLSLSGGLVAALLTGGELTLGALAGLLAVVGLAARGVVVLIRRYQQLVGKDASAFGPETVIRGTTETLPATVLSALACVAVLAPFAVLGNAVGFDVLQPMAVVILGGLVTTTLVNVFVVPPLYLRYGAVSGPDAWTDDLFHAPREEEPVPARKGGGVLRRVRSAAPALAGLVPVLLVSACGGSVAADAYVIEHEPAKVVTVPGDPQPRVVLEKAAAERLRIQTAPVRGTAGGLVVPTTAVFVDTSGVWWVFTSPKPLEYVRHKVEIDRQHGARTFLKDGPPPGTAVVTVGAAELWGVEEEVGH